VARPRLATHSHDHLPRHEKPSRKADAAVQQSSLPELDRLIHERMRLGIISALALNDTLSFNDLKRVL